MKNKLLNLIALCSLSLIVSCGQTLPSVSNGEPTTSPSTQTPTTETTTTNKPSTTTTSKPTTTAPSIPEENSEVTVQEFIKYASTSRFYKLTGTITKITHNQYGNFNLKDDTGEIYVWGLLESKGSSDKFWFETSGLKVGDEITIAGKYKLYNGTHEVVDAYFISLENSSSGDNNDNNYSLTDFTEDEKALLNSTFGFVLPFAPTDEYYIDTSYLDYGLLNYYSCDMTSSDYNNYKNICDSTFTFTETYTDEFCTWYIYSYKDAEIEIGYYNCEFEDGSYSYIIDVWCYIEVGDSGDSGDVGELKTDFSNDEKTFFNQSIGFVIPFAPAYEYYVTDYISDYGLINYFVLDQTQEDFNNYKSIWDDTYTYLGTDEYEGTTLYVYSNNGITMDISYYNCEFNDGSTSYIIDVYLYISSTEGDDSGSGSTTPVDGLQTNYGKGLPGGTNGIYDVDFTKASPLRDVHDQGYYLGGCPTTGDVNVLVIPVEFSDVTASSKGYTIDSLEKVFNDTTTNKEYPSVKEFYEESSYGKLNLNFDILDTWFRPSNPSSYYINLDKTNDGSSQVTSEQYIIEEALTKLDSQINFADYDSDNNGSIDAIVLVNTLSINYDVDLQWAFRYWNLNFDAQGNYYTHDNKFANDYLWASYEFLLEDGTGYNSKTPDNTYTFIHEFGHVLGSDDYYDTSYSDNDDAGLRGYDVMDSGFGDHNPYTKFNYGWITKSRLVTTDTSITIDLEDFSKNGDTVILANNFDPAMGVYQEYYVLMYYTNNGINSTSHAGYFNEEGILMYHVNASYYVEEYYGETYYDVYNNNDLEGEYATEDMLIEFIKNGNDFIFGVGDSSSKNIKDDNNQTLAYSFKVNSLTNGKANLTITKN